MCRSFEQGKALSVGFADSSPRGRAKEKNEPGFQEKQKEAGNRFLSFYMVEDKMKKMKNCYLQVL